MTCFPIILYPSAIQQAQDALPPLSPLPALDKPQPPELPKAPQPIGDPPRSLDLKLLGFGGGIGLAVVWGLLQSNPGSGMVGFLLLTLGLGIGLWYRQIKFPALRQAHQQQVADYEQQQLRYQQNLKALPQRKRDYQQALQQYEAELAQLKAIHHTPEKVAQFRREQVQSVLKQTISYDGNQGDAKAGHSEKVLAKSLKPYFRDRIHRNLTLAIPGSVYSYQPDFAYLDPKSGLHLDIEVDEPYAYDTGEAIHYIGKDDRRNEFFLEKGWVVIRFSEEQVQRHPEGCCQVIAQVISQLTGKVVLLKGGIPALQPMPQWTKEEAERMSVTRRRQGYRAGKS